MNAKLTNTTLAGLTILAIGLASGPKAQARPQLRPQALQVTRDVATTPAIPLREQQKLSLREQQQARDNAKERYQYGLANSLLERHAEAIVHYNQAIELAPHNSDFYLQRGISYAQLGRLEAADSDFQQAIALNPGNAFAHYNLGKAQARLGNLTTARQAYQKATVLYRQQGQDVDARIAQERLNALSVASRS